MRIATWNMAGKTSNAHTDFVLEQDCDVLLLTEVKHTISLTGYEIRHSQDDMTDGRWWAAVASRLPFGDQLLPHPASAAAEIGDTTFVASVLPWRSSGGKPPWQGANQAERTQNVVQELLTFLRSRERVVWGGDWNHALIGKEYAGCRAGRAALQAALAELKLVAPTADLPHRLPTLFSIDHIALADGDHERYQVDATGLSDHDLYMIDTVKAGSVRTPGNP